MGGARCEGPEGYKSSVKKKDILRGTALYQLRRLYLFSFILKCVKPSGKVTRTQLTQLNAKLKVASSELMYSCTSVYLYAVPGSRSPRW